MFLFGKRRSSEHTDLGGRPKVEVTIRLGVRDVQGGTFKDVEILLALERDREGDAVRGRDLLSSQKQAKDIADAFVNISNNSIEINDLI